MSRLFNKCREASEWNSPYSSAHVQEFRRKEWIAVGAFFLFWFFFLSLRLPVEMWEIPRQ